MADESLQEKIRQAIAVENGWTLCLLREDIMNETIKLAHAGHYEVAGRTVSLPDAGPMMSGTVLYSAPFETGAPPLERPTIVKVLDSDTLLAGKSLSDEGYNPAVLNFANRQTPGGGVLNGAGAQEENIFRRSSLFLSLYQFHKHGKWYRVPQRREQYPLDLETGGVYSPQVTVFRGLEQDGYPLLEEPYQLGVVTVAALNHPPLEDPDHLTDEMVRLTRQKIRTIYRIALRHGHDALVLGAWGCGAFRNPPAHIARLFHETMDEDEFRNRFGKIVFAIIDRKGVEITAESNGNLGVFQAEFGNGTD